MQGCTQQTRAQQKQGKGGACREAKKYPTKIRYNTAYNTWLLSHVSLYFQFFRAYAVLQATVGRSDLLQTVRCVSCWCCASVTDAALVAEEAAFEKDMVGTKQILVRPRLQVPLIVTDIFGVFGVTCMWSHRYIWCLLRCLRPSSLQVKTWP